MRFSIVIPAHNEEDFLPSCLDAIEAAAARCQAGVETIVVLNRCTDRTEEIAGAHRCRIVREDARNLARIRNAGAATATGEILVTVDADSRMSPRTLFAIERKLASGRFIGGATIVRFERLSLGICLSCLAILFHLLRHGGLTYGLFFCRKEDFDALGGFDESLVTVEDVDFRKRLVARGRARRKRFATLWTAPLTTSCRKFDLFGDWFFLKNPGFLKRSFSGRDRQAGDEFWYDVRGK
ncbi:MAG: glycosyltransferase [Akkermansiaceae bacterium]|nr:glycosyltransferase [Akkermansiaceae bacterium]